MRRRFSKDEKSATNWKFVQSYLRDLDCPRSLTVWLLFKYREYDQIATLEIDPLQYENASSFEPSFRATKFLSKASFLKTTFNRTEVALAGFKSAEELCRITNHTYLTDRNIPDQYAGLLMRIRRKIGSVLGDFDTEEFFDSCGWGPGVTQSLKKDYSIPNKFHREGEITRAAYDLVYASARLAYPRWFSNLNPVIVPSRNHVITVPKNAKTDRTIAVEPGLNLWFQKGCGRMIRSRLQRNGVNLNDASRNQFWAKHGSSYGNIATVDFSSASDTISRKLVEWLLPPDWFCVLESLRCTGGKLRDGSLFTYEKFSSMGNGFTFELESLIFFCTALVVSDELGLCRDVVSVFGDDVTIDTQAFSLYQEVCNVMGFTVNSRKSYYTGAFREACGAYYFDGIDVKPYFFKKEFYDEATLYVVANSVRLRHITACSACSDGRFLRTWRFLYHHLHKLTKGKVRKIPLHGSGGLVVNFDEAAPCRARGYIEGYWYFHLNWKPQLIVADHQGLLLARLREIGNVDIEYGNTYPHSSRGKWIVIRSLVNVWPDVGPWFVARD